MSVIESVIEMAATDVLASVWGFVGQALSIWRSAAASFFEANGVNGLFEAAFLVGVGVFVFGLFWIFPSGESREVRFWRRGAIMTPNEQEFHERLQRAFPEYEFWPQVSMLALMQPRLEPRDRESWRRFNAVSARRVDWVMVCHGAPRIVIELDDRTHDLEGDAWRDALLMACGWPVVRFDSRRKPDVPALRRVIEAALAKRQKEKAA